MIRLLQQIVFGHVHKWKIIKEYEVARAGDGKVGGVKDGDIVATAYFCQCEECGSLKFQKDWVFANS